MLMGVCIVQHDMQRDEQDMVQCVQWTDGVLVRSLRSADVHATILLVGKMQTCKKPNFTQVREIGEIGNQQNPHIPNFAKLKFSPCMTTNEISDHKY